MIHCMLDIEALDRKNTAAVLSLGAIAWDQDDQTTKRFKIVGQFYQRFDLRDVMRLGGTVGVDTLLWWLTQEPEAIAEAFSLGERHNVGLRNGLRSFGKWYKFHRCERVWANGTTYDINILNTSFEMATVKLPWPYNAVRDMRYFHDVPDPDGAMKAFCDAQYNTGVAHHALDDAMRQAVITQAYLQYIDNSIHLAHVDGGARGMDGT